MPVATRFVMLRLRTVGAGYACAAPESPASRAPPFSGEQYMYMNVVRR